MNILGIETSSIVCSVGLASDRGLSIERNIIDPHIHSEKLLTLLTEILNVSELTLQEIDAVTISIGPGSFTGLRIGLSTAKGLCYALGRNLVAVPTFDAVARLARERESYFSHIHIAVDAKQGEFYYSALGRGGVRAPNAVEIRALRLEELHWMEVADDSTLWITDRPDVIRGYGVKQDFIREFSLFCRGDNVARFGMEKFVRGEFADLPTVEPMYLKEFVVKPVTI